MARCYDWTYPWGKEWLSSRSLSKTSKKGKEPMSEGRQIEITVNFGLSNSLTRKFPEGTTVKDIIGNPNIMAALGHGNNVVAKIDGVTQEPGTRLSDGD